MTPYQYPVVEIFESIQFEGWRAGTVAMFVRLAGCNLACPFCDTDHEAKTSLTATEIVLKLAHLSPKNRQVVLTGGEPTIHPLSELTSLLGKNGYYIALETNGTWFGDLNLTKRVVGCHWVTVSPKTALGRDDSAKRLLVSEWKIIVPNHEALIDWVHPRISLQPVWGDPEALQRAIKLARGRHNVRISVQTHKYLGVR